MAKDILQRFVFDNADVRGALVTLEQGYAGMLASRNYESGEQAILGEFAAAAVLLVSQLKFEGSLALQVRGGEGVDLVVVECTDQLEFRGTLSGSGVLSAYNFGQVFADGILAMTMSPREGQRYQGIIPLQGGSLATSLGDYFRQSEQLPSWFTFAMSGERVVGMMLQALPAQVCPDPEDTAENWARLVHLASTLTGEEMLQLDHEELLYRLYHEEKVRLFELQPVQYRCTCSRERMERGLLSLGSAELLQILAEQEDISTQCHFCGREYHFSRGDITDLLRGSGSHNSH